MNHSDNFRDRMFHFIENDIRHRTRPRGQALDLRNHGLCGARDLRERPQQLIRSGRRLLDFLDQRGKFAERPIRGLNQKIGLADQPNRHDRKPDHRDRDRDDADLSEEWHPRESFRRVGVTSEWRSSGRLA